MRSFTQMILACSFLFAIANSAIAAPKPQVIALNDGNRYVWDANDFGTDFEQVPHNVFKLRNFGPKVWLGNSTYHAGRAIRHLRVGGRTKKFASFGPYADLPAGKFLLTPYFKMKISIRDYRRYVRNGVRGSIPVVDPAFVVLDHVLDFGKRKLGEKVIHEDEFGKEEFWMTPVVLEGPLKNYELRIVELSGRGRLFLEQAGFEIRRVQQ